MKAANYRDTGLTQSQSQIVGAQNDITRAAGGTEKAQERFGQNIEIAAGPYLGTGS